MRSCDNCGETILFGGVRHEDLRFCNANCLEQAEWVHAASTIPEVDVERRVREVHQGQCPKCLGAGPVDVHSSHWVYSALLWTSWGSRAELCCRACGNKTQWRDGAFSMLLGWWGAPFGLFITPVQLTRNFVGITGLKGPNDMEPSPELRRWVQRRLVAERNGQ